MRTDVKLLLKIGISPLIISAGMQRSASTLLFNIVRLCLSAKYHEGVAVTWIEDVDEFKKGRVNVVKLHWFGRLLAYRASHIFYTYRDVRDAMVSSCIKFNTPCTMETCEFFINQYRQASKYASLMISYEDIVDNTGHQVRKVAEILKIDVDSQAILDKLPRINPVRSQSEGYDKISQMHGGHGSGMKPKEWKTMLPESVQEQIAEEYAWWFAETGYEL